MMFLSWELSWSITASFTILFNFKMSNYFNEIGNHGSFVFASFWIFFHIHTKQVKTKACVQQLYRITDSHTSNIFYYWVPESHTCAFSVIYHFYFIFRISFPSLHSDLQAEMHALLPWTSKVQILFIAFHTRLAADFCTSYTFNIGKTMLLYNIVIRFPSYFTSLIMSCGLKERK